ncbi:nucleotide sugar dehydrogenase [Oceanobacillus timonensis]|uniref:nucleotide sugar dehydrogenase n=1 Tax=Oceanobacillus timonensis TaxID=1926285 RepID=UPI0009B9F8F0|nr:nucleotide sugar dehydrogenase [Oceanobacillus timonensis]
MNFYNTAPETTKIGVIGLGYVGLPLALLFVQKGYQVTGIDIDKDKIARLQKYASYIPDIKDSDIKSALSSGQLTLATDYTSIESLNIIVICVPTPLTGNQNPDLRYLKGVSEELYPRLQKKQLVILESSTYPGTTRDVIQPILEKSQFHIGTDVHLAYSPERIDPGNKTMKVEEIPKVVSGITTECLTYASDFYNRIFKKVVPATSVEVAELSKLLENSYRFINISFINEMAMLCDKLNINLWEAISSASSKPYGFQPFYPGPGIGGHCIPIDPLYLYWVGQKHGFHNQFLSLAESTNNDIASYIITQVVNLVEKNKEMKDANILLCGITYKKDSNDVRSSPPVRIMQRLLQLGADVIYHDSHVPDIEINHKMYNSLSLSPEVLNEMDIVVILADHSDLQLEKIIHHSKLVYDTKNITKGLQGKAQIIVLGGGNG